MMMVLSIEKKCTTEEMEQPTLCIVGLKETIIPLAFKFYAVIAIGVSTFCMPRKSPATL